SSCKQVKETVVPNHLATEMRSSIIFLGPMLARCKEISISYPGGCEIGPRPIDIHIKALKKMGAEIFFANEGILCCKAKELIGCEMNLDYPSVGATENIMLAAVYAKGRTIINNPAKEPEIISLQNFLKALGVSVYGAGSGRIVVEGCDEIDCDMEFDIIPDRIEAGTFMAAAAITEGDLVLENIIPGHIRPIILKMTEAGCQIQEEEDRLRIMAPKILKAVDIIRTSPYPGFPTDMQPQMTSILSVAQGTSIMIETVFDNRFGFSEELKKMSADIIIEGRTAVIKGVSELTGTYVKSKDLRGGAALILAGLKAKGETVVDGAVHIERGYDRIEDKLRSVGADIIKID
ncbi:MAG TPA: UDP-N-acetylglucosamine 1-carboxyvinyltransferase, partial [Clostridiales bacterium]|nr:UDP-N-acetylglucosamine 1-carboxyvinyltransferase [Clostridiales bacterium]